MYREAKPMHAATDGWKGLDKTSFPSAVLHIAPSPNPVCSIASTWQRLSTALHTDCSMYTDLINGGRRESYIMMGELSWSTPDLIPIYFKIHPRHSLSEMKQ